MADQYWQWLIFAVAIFCAVVFASHIGGDE